MEINGFGVIMTREELQNKFGDAICEYCSNNEHESSCDQVCDEHEF